MFENSRSSWDAALRWHAAHPYHRMLTAAAPNSTTTDAPAPPHGDPPPAAAAGDGPPLDAGTLTQRARRSARAAWVAPQVHETTTTCMRCLNMQDLLTSRDCAQGRPRPSCPCPPVVPAPAHAPAPAAGRRSSWPRRRRRLRGSSTHTAMGGRRRTRTTTHLLPAFRDGPAGEDNPRVQCTVGARRH